MNHSERSTKNPSQLFSLLSGLIAAAVLSRVVVPAVSGHASNFSPLDAIALFSGAYFGRRLLAFLIPVVALVVSDVAVNLLVLGTLNPFYPGWYWQAIAYLSIVGLGVWLGSGKAASGISSPRILGGSLAASLTFFVISNFGVWLTSGMYPLSITGLILCFVAAIPFFGATIASDLFYSVVMFGSVEVVRRKQAEPLAVASAA